MELETGLNFYCDAVKGAIKVLRTIPRSNEVIVAYEDGARSVLKLTEVISNFKNKYYRLHSISGLQPIINDPAEIIIVRMGLPGLRERIQSNIDLITIGTPDGTILLEAYNGYLKTIDGLIKKLNA